MLTLLTRRGNGSITIKALAPGASAEVDKLQVWVAVGRGARWGAAGLRLVIHHQTRCSCQLLPRQACQPYM